MSTKLCGNHFKTEHSSQICGGWLNWLVIAYLILDWTSMWIQIRSLSVSITSTKNAMLIPRGE